MNPIQCKPQAQPHFSVFAADRLLASGDLRSVAQAARASLKTTPEATLLFFDDHSGEVLDIDLRGSMTDVERRLAARFGAGALHAEPPDVEALVEAPAEAPAPPSRGRPRLGVVAREVTLLPRHWDWLNAQPGSASVVLRRLVDEARHTHAERDRRRQSQKAAYLFMSTLAGNRPNYEEAIRALFAGDRQRLLELMSGWPEDIRNHADRLAAPAFGSTLSIDPS
ncbi:MAG: DUF2239 family protein [Rubrivivax sp.]|nr:DUF2239 family protein [Rubrivivax sp.]MBK8526971.1 DUF2239 family protein [Rubrivivax sp.]